MKRTLTQRVVSASIRPSRSARYSDSPAHPRGRRIERAGASPTGPAVEDAALPLAERREGPSLDRALYNCSCGMVFEADVSTSVDCPHCGGQQAW